MQGYQYVLIGFGIGLVLTIFVLFWQVSKRRRAISEANAKVEKLKTMLNDRMDLESSGLAGLKVELEKLRKENENLRISLNSLAQKPGRKEVQRLQVYQDAVDRLMISSPGFGAAWQTSLKEAEAELEKSYLGAIPFIRRVIPQKSSAPVIDLAEDDNK